MAFVIKSNLAARLVTASVVLPLLLWLLFRGPEWAWCALVMLVTLLAATELFGMTHPGDPAAQSVLVVSTGLVLLYPVEVTQVLPGSLVPVAMVAHSNEGLLAFLTIITWHIYNAHLNPDVFPFDTTIFTGKISLERMRHEHPRELERVLPAAAEKADGTHPVT